MPTQAKKPGRPLSYQMGCLNIRVHTKHEPGEYVALWTAMHRARTPYVWPSGLAVMIGSATRRALAPADGFFGDLYRFVKLDADSAWFNIDAHKPAEQDDLAKIQIPPSLQPNLKSVPYYFDVVRHRLYFVTQSSAGGLSPIQAEKLVKSLATRPKIIERFGQVDVQVATDVEDVQKLLRWPVLRHLVIELERPNPTDFDDEAAVFRHLQGLGARRERREYSKAEGVATLVPDDEMRAMAKVAADNGRVQVRGTDTQNAARTADSQHYPWRKRFHYHPKVELMVDSFLENVRDLFSRKRL